MNKFDPASVQALQVLLQRSERPVLLIHKNPDGDAIGSSSGFSRFIQEAYGKQAPVIAPNAAPVNLFLDADMAPLVHAERPDLCEKMLREADLVVCMDFNKPDRLNMNRVGLTQLGDLVDSLTCPKVLIDHHLDPADFDVVFSCIKRSSTSELAFLVMEALQPDHVFTARIGAPIMMGIITDTGGFSYNSSNPDTFRVVSDLLESGVDKDAIIDKVLNNASETRLRLLGSILKDKMKVLPEYGAAYFILTREDFANYSIQNGETEGFVNYPLSIKGIIFSVFLREDEHTDEIRISLRSKGDFSVNDLSNRYFQGGGHKNASGGSFHGSVRDAESLLLKAIEENAEALKRVSSESIA